MTDTPHPAPLRRFRSRFAAGALATLAAGAGLAGLAPATGAATSTTTVKLPDGTPVLVDNLSTGYRDSAVETLVKRADNSMGTQNSSQTKVRGQMSRNDRVVVTDAGLYWLDVSDRGGLLSGMWALKNVSGTPAFANEAKKGWSPNYLLPGSNGNATARPYDAGQYVSVLATGATDGRCDLGDPGHGKFVISSSNLCGRELPAASKAQPSVAGSAYTFAGTLYEAGTGATTMVDADGRRAQVGYALTYRFSGAGVQTELVLTPSAPLDLTTIVVGGVSDYGTSPYLPRAYSVSNKDRVHFTDPATQQSTGCGASRPVGAGSVAKLCTGSVNGTNFVVTNTVDYGETLTTNGPLAAGDYVTAQQRSDSTTTQRQVTYSVVGGVGSTIPQSIDHVWNKAVGVVSLDADFVNGGDLPTGPDSPFKGAFDITMAGR